MFLFFICPKTRKRTKFPLTLNTELKRKKNKKNQSTATDVGGQLIHLLLFFVHRREMSKTIEVKKTKCT